MRIHMPSTHTSSIHISPIVVLFLLLAIMISGCTKNIIDGMVIGRLEGRIDIGPLCSVERNPPDPRCQPTLETYKAWPIVVYSEDKQTKMRYMINPSIDGNYSVELPAGKYVVALDAETINARIGGSNLPAMIEIIKDEKTILNITIDTGMR